MLKPFPILTSEYLQIDCDELRFINGAFPSLYLRKYQPGLLQPYQSERTVYDLYTNVYILFSS